MLHEQLLNNHSNQSYLPIDKICSKERSDVYLVNESSKHEPVNRVYKIREKSQSLLNHPRIMTCWETHYQIKAISY